MHKWCSVLDLVYDQTFYGEGSSERCLKWGCGGSLRDLSKNILKQGWVKANVAHSGESF